MELFKKCFAEFGATFILVVFGCGTAISTNGDVVATSLAFGISIVIIYYVLGKISGGHANPAVSLAMAIDGKITWRKFIFYLISQLLGAALAVLAIRIIFGSGHNYGANLCMGQVIRSNNFKTYFVGISIEILLTFVFVLTVLGVTSKKEYRKCGGLVIGLALVLVYLFGINLTGTSVNPARSLLPAIFAGGLYLEQSWIFVIAPLAGGVLAALFWKFLKTKKEL